MRPARYGFVLGIVWTVVGCNNPPQGQPEDAVKHFFQAVEARDCEAAIGTLSQAYRAELKAKNMSCDEYIETWRRFELERVIGTQVDGRNKNAHLVRTHMRKRETDSIFRVEAEDGQWRISSM